MSNYNLVIVESPAKARTINNYLGSDFKVVSCGGHIRDLAKDKKSSLGIDIENGFKPAYKVDPKKKKIVSELKGLAKAASEVILASDEDREGEAIAWHLCHVLGLDEKTTKRIVFHEITKPAIQAALSSPRFINHNLVNAQQSRRILDRIVGFELSPVLWKKLNNYKLSAGRVQSVAVRLILDKEDLIVNHKIESWFETTAVFKTEEGQIVGKLKQKFDNLNDAKQFLNSCREVVFSVADLKTKTGTQRPNPPFKTSSLQQTASSRLGYSPKKTMMLAQELYEAGQITYHRTDSLNLSQQFRQSVTSYVVAEFGKDYSDPKNYQTKKSDAQEAHEAIRPTSIATKQLNFASKNKSAAQRLYKLIYQRAVASQMAPAKTNITTITIASSDLASYQFIVKGKTLIFDGFLKIDQSQIPADLTLPKLTVGTNLIPKEIRSEEKLTKPPARYTEASLIGKLEDLGIGRPSTYAPIINTITKRGYVEKGDIEPDLKPIKGLVLENGQVSTYDSQVAIGGATNKLIPTDLAKLVNKFLIKYFTLILDYDFTNKVEDQLDQIAGGQLDWKDQLAKFYQTFHPLVESGLNVDKAEVNPPRELGVDPADGVKVYARVGRFGPMLQKGETTDEEKPRFAPLPAKTTIETVSLDQALKMFQLPRTVGQDQSGNPILIKTGPYGPYVEAGKIRASIKGLDPFVITVDQAKQLIVEKEKEAASKIIREFEDSDLKIMKSRFNTPYLSNGKQISRFPKKADPKTITFQEANDFFEKNKNIRRKRSK